MVSCGGGASYLAISYKVMCDLDCFNCTYPDCINDGELDNSIRCRSWYERNREKKIEYQKAYNRRVRANKPQKKDKPKEVPKECKLLSFKELEVLLCQ